MKKLLSLVLTAILCLSVLSGAAAETLSGSIATDGSTSMEKVIGILSEQFMADNPDVQITYNATGSGTGIAAALNGTADIGLSSRALKDEEVAQGLLGTVVALDGIAIIVNEKCPVDNLTLEQVADIFTGKITSWKDLGGEGDIACIGREAGSGTRDGFESITKTKDANKLQQELTSTGAVITAVASNEAAIGYASSASVEGKEGIKVLTIDGIECTEDNIKAGTYVIQRPFVLVTKEGVELTKQAQAFIDYMLSEEAAPLAKEKAIELDISGQSAAVWGLPKLLYSLTFNLIENAIRYNKQKGKVEINIQKQNSACVLRVKDTGIGIPKDELEHIFQRFYRVDKGRSSGGTGLGLALVKHAAQIHDATIDVQSTPGQGTTMTVRFPCPKKN